MTSLFCALWNIPDGFATLVGGFFVVVAAAIAWASVQRQIGSAENIERARTKNEIAALESGFTAELFVYSRSVIEATSLWNRRAHQAPGAAPVAGWPLFVDPLYYRTNIGKIGMTRHQWVIGALIGFYTNMLEMNDQAREAVSGRPTVNTTMERIAARLRIMAANLSQALDGLNDDRKFPPPPELSLEDLFSPDGMPLSKAAKIPQSLQEVLLRLAGAAERPVEH